MTLDLTRILAVAAVSCLACGPAATSGDTDATTNATDSATSTGSTTGDPTSTTAGSGTTTGGGDACGLAPDPGPCEAAFPKWWFNPETQRCEMFYWGGCDGTVPFDEEMECEQACEPCQAFDEVEPPEVTVAVTIRNDLSDPVHLDVARPVSNQQDYYFTRHYDIEQGGETLRTNVGFCEQEFSCQNVDNDLCGGCDPGPPQLPPEPIEIAPQSTFDAEDWRGQVWEDTVRPQRCVSEQCQSQGITEAACHRLRSVSGQFTARARGFVGDPDGPALETTATFLVPDELTVELVFQ